MAVFLPVISSLNSSRPALLDLKITNWELFAAHLPGVTQSLIQSIGNEFPSSEQRLERLYQCWLKICPHASWLHVLIALLEAKENDIYCNLLGKVTSKRSWVASRSQEDVVASIDDLRKRFEVILKEMKDALTISAKPLEKIVSEVEQFLEMEKGELSHHIFNIDELFNELQPYCNYFNFKLIQFLQVQFLKGTAATMESTVVEYAKNLLLLLQSAKLSFVVSAMPTPASHKTKTTTSFRFKLSSAWQNYSLHTLLKTLEYSLNVKGIYFCHIYMYKNRRNFSLFRLKVFLPKSCEQQLQALLVSNQQRLLQLGIMKCDETITSDTSELDLIRFKASCFKAVQEKDTIALIIMLLCRLVSADCTNESKETPLMISAREGHEDIVCTLLLAGANVNITNADEDTAIILASAERHRKIARILSRQNAEVKLKEVISVSKTAMAIGNKFYSLSTTTSKGPEKEELRAVSSLPVSVDKNSHPMSGQSLNLEPPMTDATSMEGQKVTIKKSPEETAPNSISAEQHKKSSIPAASVKQEENPAIESENLEYSILRENMPKLNRMLTGNPDLIIKLATHLFAKKIITETTSQKASNVNLGAVERASDLLNSVLTTLSLSPARKEIFDNFCTSLDQLGMDTTMLKRHDDTVTKTGGSSTVGSLEQSTSQELEHNAFRFDKDQERETKSMIESIDKEFTTLASNVRELCLERIERKVLKFDHLVQYIAQRTRVPVKELKEDGPESLFDLIQDKFDAFNCDVIGYIIEEILNDKTLKEKFTKHKSIIAKFQELTPIKDIIQHVNKVIPPAAVKPADSCTVLIKVHQIWDKITKSCLIKFLNCCIGHDITNNICIRKSSICVEFFIPMAESQDIIDRVMSKRDDLYQLGIYYMMIDETKIIDKADSINLEEALLQFAQDGKQFEVSMALDLGADINWQNEFGMTALVIATEEGHTEVVKELLRKRADAELPDDAGQTALDVATKKNESELIAILSKRTSVIASLPIILSERAISKREPSIITKDDDKEEKKQEKTKIKGPGPISLSDPSEEDCRRIINEAKNHEDITFSSNKVDIVRMFLLLLKDRKLKRLVIQDTNLTTNCIISLLHLITTNVTLEELELRNCVEKNYDESVFDDKLAEELCTSLKRNTTLKKLSLRSMKLSEEAIYNFMDMMYDNKLICLKLDSNHRDICKESTYFMDEEISKRIEFIKI